MSVPSKPGIKVLNIKSGMPTVDEARALLANAIATAKSEGCRVIKLVHGYGSSGKGGALKSAIRSSLRRRRKEGTIRSFIAGEEFETFSAETLEALHEYPELRYDSDLNKSNEGITMVLL